MGKEFKVATEREIAEIATQLRHYNLWFLYRTFALQYYGPKAYAIEVESEGEYNDEGGTDYQVSSFIVKDHMGRTLEYDLNQPVFQELIIPEFVKYQDLPHVPYENLSIQLDDAEFLGVVRYIGVNSSNNPDFILWIRDFPSSGDYDNVGGEFLVAAPSVKIPLLYLEVNV